MKILCTAPYVKWYLQSLPDTSTCGFNLDNYYELNNKISQNYNSNNELITRCYTTSNATFMDHLTS